MVNTCRQAPLLIGEYENEFRRYAGDLQLVERVFYGGLGSNKLRAALWPYIFGLVKQRGLFIKKSPSLAASNGTAAAATTAAVITSNAITSTAMVVGMTTNGRTTNGYTNSGSNHIQTNGLATKKKLHHHDDADRQTTASSSSAASSSAASSEDDDDDDDDDDHDDHDHDLSMSEDSAHDSPATPRRNLVNGNGANCKAPKESDEEYIYIEHEDNLKRWRELEKSYHHYESQWRSIMPDQERRFSVFRERKALIERDVVRSDRSHPFYADISTNLTNLTTLLMTYMMYDFDIGYLQGMSDLAAPILYVYHGDLVKAFWVFVEVMKLFRRNFEYSQKTIPFQLNCLYRLIRLTDPKLAHYLRDNECANCFFVFRCIVCQFKRELMKGSSADGHLPADGYTEVLNLWDTIWSVQRRHELLARSKCVHTYTIANSKHKRTNSNSNSNSNNNNNNSNNNNNTALYSIFDPNQADVPRFELTETEKFVLSLCLSLIRRERNQILLNRLDASEIHQHFINPHLTRDFDHFLDQAYEVYQYLNSDCDLQLLVKGASKLNAAGNAVTSDLSPLCGADPLLAPDDDPDGEGAPEAADTYDLLKDYLIISPTSYNIPLASLNNLNGSANGSPNGLASKTNYPANYHHGHNHHHHHQHQRLTVAPATTTTATMQHNKYSHDLQTRKRSLASRYSVSQRSWDQFLQV